MTGTLRPAARALAPSCGGPANWSPRPNGFRARQLELRAYRGQPGGSEIWARGQLELAARRVWRLRSNTANKFWRPSNCRSFAARRSLGLIGLAAGSGPANSGWLGLIRRARTVGRKSRRFGGPDENICLAWLCAGCSQVHRSVWARSGSDSNTGRPVGPPADQERELVEVTAWLRLRWLQRSQRRPFER